MLALRLRRIIDRELKQRRRQRRKTIGLTTNINRSAHALRIVAHFFAVLCETDNMKCLSSLKTDQNCKLHCEI